MKEVLNCWILVGGIGRGMCVVGWGISWILLSMVWGNAKVDWIMI